MIKSIKLRKFSQVVKFSFSPCNASMTINTLRLINVLKVNLLSSEAQAHSHSKRNLDINKNCNTQSMTCQPGNKSRNGDVPHLNTRHKSKNIEKQF